MFTNFDGRISRKGFWMGFLGLIVAVLIAGRGMISILPGGIVPMLAQIVVSVGSLYIWSAVVVKRLHDRDKPAMPWAVLFLAPGVLLQIMSMFKIGYRAVKVAGAQFMVPGTGATMVMWLSMAVGLWMFVELGFLKGTPGENSYGPDPAGGTAPREGQAEA